MSRKRLVAKILVKIGGLGAIIMGLLMVFMAFLLPCIDGVVWYLLGIFGAVLIMAGKKVTRVKFRGKSGREEGRG